MPAWSRRAFLGISAGASLELGTLVLPRNGIADEVRLTVLNGPGLGALARRHNRLYGAAIQSAFLGEPDFAAALRREVALLVPETELKWNVLRPSPDTFDFAGYDRIADFAGTNDMAMRGHVLVWHGANPDWLEPALDGRNKAETILQQHISGVLRHTAPVIRNWDVVNEAVDGDSIRADGLRDTLWLRALGPDYVALAFRMAYEADPGLTLVYNDYGAECDTADGNRRRKLIRRLLEKCAAEKVPVHAFGLQSHLDPQRPLARYGFVGFLRDLRAMGLKIYITELDMHIRGDPARIDGKIKAAQSYVRTYLDMVQEGGDLDTLVTWGLTERHTEFDDIRGALPLDVDYNRGLLWYTLQGAWAER